MGNLKLLLVLVVGFCCVAVTLSASMNYEEPPIEATSDKMDDSEESSPISEDDGSGMKDEEGSGEEDDTDDMEDEEKETDDDDTMDKDDKKMDDEKDEAEDEMDDDAEKSVVETSSCPAKGSKDCEVAEALKSVVKYIKLLGEEVGELRTSIKESCKAKLEYEDESSQETEGSGDGMEGSADDSDDGEEGDDTDEEKDDMETEKDDMDDQKEDEMDDDKDEMDDDKDDMDDDKDDMDDDKDDMDDETEDDMDDEKEDIPTTTLPPPPERCPPPFQLLASSCYYIQTDTREWRSWGDANAFCQEQGGTLAAPYRPIELMEYLEQSYSGAIWVGGQMKKGKFEWLNGREITDKEWKGGKPNRSPARTCVLLDSRDRYLAVNFFCGEKFSFICEHDGEEQQSVDYY